MSDKPTGDQEAPIISEYVPELWCDCGNFEHFRVYLTDRPEEPIELFDNRIKFSEDEIEKVVCGKCGLECGKDVIYI